jgi:hypothetical protein
MKSLDELAGIRSALYEKYVSQKDLTQSEFDNLFKFTVVTPFYWGVYDLANSSSVQGYWKNQYTTTTEVSLSFTDEGDAIMFKLSL